MSPDLARKTQATGYAFFAAQLPEIPVGKVEDRTISTPKRETPVRIYWPETSVGVGAGSADGATQDRPSNSSSSDTPSTTEPLPLVVFIHGGGWVLGDLDQYNDMCRRLCKGANTIVVSVDYGLAPEWKFPEPVEECYAVTRWALEHAEALGSNPKKVAIAGDSAGGNLAAAVTLMLRDRHPVTGSGERLQLACQVLMYPAVDQYGQTESKLRNANGYFLEAEDMLWFRDCYLKDLEDAKDPLASPLLASDFHDLPPALIITAEYDPLHDEGVAYADKLRANGVPVEHKNYLGMIHGFMSMVWMFEDGVKAIDFASAHLREAFKG